MPNFRTTKIFQETLNDITQKYNHLVLNNQKSPFVNQVTAKDSYQNVPTQKHPEIENFKPRKIV